MPSDVALSRENLGFESTIFQNGGLVIKLFQLLENTLEALRIETGVSVSASKNMYSLMSSSPSISSSSSSFLGQTHFDSRYQNSTSLSSV